MPNKNKRYNEEGSVKHWPQEGLVKYQLDDAAFRAFELYCKHKNINGPTHPATARARYHWNLHKDAHRGKGKRGT